MLKGLNRGGLSYHFPRTECERIQIFTKFPRDYLVPLAESQRTSIRHLRLPVLEDILLASAHLPSKLHGDGDENSLFACRVLAQEIDRVEAKVGHRRTIVVGDLNADPFEPAISSANGLHAVMSRRVAHRGERVVQGQVVPFFYNPMWCHLGDHNEAHCGTYYYDSGGALNYYWHAFDQVLVRPALVAGFRQRELEIITRVGPHRLVTERGVPNAESASDHLPLLFRIDLRVQVS
jgi:hypothetical protein